ncbi:CLUMA_CG020743, isoform A, partial [Clunio marinus]
DRHQNILRFHRLCELDVNRSLKVLILKNLRRVKLWLFLIFILTLLAYNFENSRRRFKNTPPGPWANYIPFIGYLPFLNPQKPEQSLTKLAEKYGKIFSLQMGSIFTVVLSDATLMREAFKRDEFLGRAPLRVTHGIFHGYGLICIEGALWKDQRSLVQKWLRDLGMVKFGLKRELMQQRIMNGINNCISEFKSLHLNEVNPASVIMNAIGNIANDVVFGVTFDKNDETWKYLLHLQEEGVKLVGVNSGANFLPFLRFLPDNKKNMKFLLSGIEATHKIYDGIVDECEKTLNTSECRDSILRRFLLEKRDREERNDGLANNCSRKQLNYLLADMFGAALDTTSHTLRWYLLLIALNLDVQEKVYQEMKNHGLKEEYLLDDVAQLHYLKATIAETQRLKTVAPCGIPHGNPYTDTTLEGYYIPKNTMILPLICAVHLDKTMWENPEIYNPNRFIDSNDIFFTPSNFIPFQTGKRMCVGEELAKMVLQLFCANVLLNFRIRPGQDAATWDLSGISGLTLSPPDFQLIFEKR